MTKEQTIKKAIKIVKSYQEKLQQLDAGLIGAINIRGMIHECNDIVFDLENELEDSCEDDE